MIELTLDFVFPTTNHSYMIGSGRYKRYMYKTEQAKKCQQFLIAMMSQYAAPKGDNFGLYICTYLKNNKRDISSSTKLIQDAIAASLKINDNKIFLVIEEKVVDKCVSEHTNIKFGEVTEIHQWYTHRSMSHT